jgi:hypothetical protein
MEAKKRKGSTILIPPEIWTKVFEFLSTTKDFYSLYVLNKELHDYPWKSTVKQVEFKLNPNYESLEHSDLSYVSSSDLSEFRFYLTDEKLEILVKYIREIHGLNLGASQITDNGLSHLKGIHTLNLYFCKQVTAKDLEHLKGIHTLSLNACIVTDEGLEHLKGIQTLDLMVVQYC